MTHNLYKNYFLIHISFSSPFSASFCSKTSRGIDGLKIWKEGSFTSPLCEGLSICYIDPNLSLYSHKCCTGGGRNTSSDYVYHKGGATNESFLRLNEMTLLPKKYVREYRLKKQLQLKRSVSEFEFAVEWMEMDGMDNE